MKVTVNPAAVYAQLEDGAVILNVNTGLYFGLDPVGARVWELAGLGSTAEQIVAKLENDYAVEHHVLTADVNALLSQLEKSGLVEVTPVSGV